MARKLTTTGLALAIAWALAAPAAAVVIVYTASLGPEEAGAMGTGSTTITFDTDAATMRVEATWSGLSAGTTVAHIHCCTASPGTGAAGVATTTPTFPGFPEGVTSGSYDMTFDMTLASSWNVTFINANGGTAEGAFNALLAGLDAGTAYLNIHSENFPGGEIRGFPMIPEPATGALVLLGLAGLGAARRRAREG